MQDDNADIIKEISTLVPLSLPANTGMPELERQLSVYFNELLLHDFEKLIFLLYRIDVNETKMKQALKENEKADAGVTIAKLVIERQVQKIISRRQFRKETDDADEEEKW